MRRLTLLYDASCGFCTRAREWLGRQRPLLPLEFVPAASDRARSLFPTIEHPDPPDELVVIDDEGGVYRGDDAWIMTLYALEEYRGWSLRLASPSLRPWARAAFDWISRNRYVLSKRFHLAPDEEVLRTLRPQSQRPCRVAASGPCPVPPDDRR